MARKLDYDSDDDALAVGHYVLDYCEKSIENGDDNPGATTLQEFVNDLIGSTPRIIGHDSLDERYCARFGVSP